MGRFDAHDHLVKQGWKGKGTGSFNFPTVILISLPQLPVRNMS